MKITIDRNLLLQAFFPFHFSLCGHVVQLNGQNFDQTLGKEIDSNCVCDIFISFHLRCMPLLIWPADRDCCYLFSAAFLFSALR